MGTNQGTAMRWRRRPRRVPFRASRRLPRHIAAAAMLLSALVVVTSVPTGGATATAGAGHAAATRAAAALATTAPTPNARAPFTARGSIGQAYVVGATPGEHLVLVDSRDRVVGHGTADRDGSLIVRNVAPGTNYQVRGVEGPTVAASPRFSVLGTGPASTPTPGFYSGQHLHAGLNYLTMRDGIELAATVRLPPGKTLADGPFPTVIEYSGYPIAAPGSLITAVLHPGSVTDPTLLPTTATAVGSLIAPLLGFATVSLQMRGTGCSGGTFDLFGLDTTYDGYDAVQIVGSQPWVKGHRVGMVGISFSGISQLFVAGTRPPDLAAIAPLSVTNDLYTTGYPGGIYNRGFAASWVAQRVAAAQPAPEGGEAYARALIEQGTRQCLADQDLRLQTQDATTLLAHHPYRTPGLYDPRTPTAWARHIDVPVYLAGALQDEQTGPQWPAVVPALRHDPDVWVTMVNGTHVDSLGPAILSRWVEFLDIFVAGQRPHVPAAVEALSGSLYTLLAGAPAEPLPALRFTHAPNVAAARRNFERDTPRVRVLMDNGGGSLGPGAFQPEWEADFDAWPPPRAVTTTLDLAASGRLSTGAAAAASRPSASRPSTSRPSASRPSASRPSTSRPSASRPSTSRARPATRPASAISTATATTTVSFRPDPAARPATDLPATANPWAPLPPYDWTPVTGSDGLGFVSPVLRHDLVVVGPASLDLELRSTAPDSDLQATVSEVLPDGQEMYVQSGFLRASVRALTRSASTPTHPVPTYRRATARPLPGGRFTLVRIPIDPIGFAFRAGSRIRVTVTAPGGTRPEWAFATPATGGRVTDSVLLGGAHPSALVLPVVPGVHPPDAQPACPSLRGQPCRTYVPAGNGG